MVSKNDEFLIKNLELCTRNEGFCVRNDEFCRDKPLTAHVEDEAVPGMHVQPHRGEWHLSARVIECQVRFPIDFHCFMTVLRLF